MEGITNMKKIFNVLIVVLILSTIPFTNIYATSLQANQDVDGIMSNPDGYESDVLTRGSGLDLTWTYINNEKVMLDYYGNRVGTGPCEKVIDVSELNTNNLCEFIPIHDGFRMLFDDNEEAAVDLYLGNFGSNQDVLWVDSSDEKKILAVIDRIDKIKKINKFMNTRYIQFPQPKSFEKLDGCYKTYNYSKDSKRIYEKRL